MRLSPVRSGDPWRLAEVLVHEAAGREPWDEWLAPDLDWEARRRLLVEKPICSSLAEAEELVRPKRRASR